MLKVLESHQIILALNQKIWQQFQKLDEWQSWWLFCRYAHIDDGKLTPGNIFHLKIKGMPAALRNTQILELKEARFLAGIGNQYGIKAKQTWSFLPLEEGTQVIVRIEFLGSGVLVAHYLRKIAPYESRFRPGFGRIKESS